MKSVAVIIGVAVLAFQWGCAGPAASKTVKGAGTGAAIGAVGGLITGQDIGGVAAAAAVLGGVHPVLSTKDPELHSEATLRQFWAECAQS